MRKSGTNKKKVQEDKIMKNEIILNPFQIIEQQRRIQPTSLNDAIERWLSKSQLTERTQDNYRGYMKEFVSWLDSKQISNPTTEDLMEYVQYLTHKQVEKKDRKGNTWTEPMKPESIATYIAPVKSFFHFTDLVGIYPNIAKGLKVKNLDSSERTRKPLTIEQAQKLLDSIDTTTEKGARDKAIIQLSLVTGLRSVSISLADVKDLREHSGLLVLWYQGKSRKEKGAFVKIPDNLSAAINHYLSFRTDISPEEPLFKGTGNRNNRLTTQTIRKMFKKRLIAAGLPEDLSFHCLRHSCSFNLLESGIPITEISQLLNHKSISTTMIYADHKAKISRKAEQVNDDLFK